ncbi:MAG: arylesterase [Pseudomonadota bacterium]
MMITLPRSCRLQGRLRDATRGGSLHARRKPVQIRSSTGSISTAIRVWRSISAFAEAARALLFATFSLLSLACLMALLGKAEVRAADAHAEPAPVAGEPGTASPTVLVLGDSISAAYGMALERGWVALAEQRLRRQWPGLAMVNASISGDTSAGGLRRLPRLLEEHAPQLVIIELGGNDGLRGYPTPKLEQNLTQMAQLAKDAGAAALLLPMEIPPNYGPRYTDAFRQSFRTASKSTGATLGPFILERVATDRGLMQSDGIHPTEAAQPLLVDTVEQAIVDALSMAVQPG